MDKLLTWLNAERGRRLSLAGTLGISQAAISQWPQVPVERVLAVESVTGISRHDLRPDIYGPASTSEVA